MNKRNHFLSFFQKCKGFFLTQGLKPLFIFFKWLNWFLAGCIVILIRMYQHSLSLMFPASCRFFPSCSQYGIEAFKSHGVFKGLFLTVKRILKCHPWHKGGYDPVPGHIGKKPAAE